MSSDASTPLMRQYNSIKEQVPHALLMFRLGDFYELFFEDAVTAARELEITLTSRNKEKGAAIPMCGVPYHAAEGYIARLIQKGYRVAICDQMEDPKLAKKLVRREITRVVTPGTAMDANLVRSHENNYLAAVARIGSRSGVAHVDISTGEFRVTELDPADVAGALEQLNAREVLFPGDLPLLAGDEATGAAPRFVRTELEDWIFTQDYASRTLRDHFKLLTLDGCGLANRPAAVGAAGARHAARRARPPRPPHLLRPRRFHDPGCRHGEKPGADRAPLRRRRRPDRSNRPPCSARSARASPAWACGSACCAPRSTREGDSSRLCEEPDRGNRPAKGTPGAPAPQSLLQRTVARAGCAPKCEKGVFA